MNKVNQIIQRIFMALLIWAGRLKARRPHQGAKPLLPNSQSLIIQPELVCALGNPNKAAIVQKLHEWIEYNRSQNKHTHFIDGKWWAYNSYAEWQSNHFRWIKTCTVKKLFQELVAAGILYAEQQRKDRGDCRLWHAINYAALDALLKDSQGGVNDSQGGSQKTPSWESLSPTPASITPPTTAESTKSESAIDKPVAKRKLQSKTTSNNSSPVAADAAPVILSELDSGEFAANADNAESADTGIVEETAHDDPTAPAPRFRRTPLPPRSAAPPDLPESAQALIARMVDDLPQLTAYYAEHLITEYGEDDVRAVYEYCRRNRSDFNKPVGWIASELKHRRMGLPPLNAGEALVAAGSRYTTGKYADIIEH
jgi:hypothetical protein